MEKILKRLIFVCVILFLFANMAKAVPCECENKDGKTDCSKCFQEATDRILPGELKKALEEPKEKPPLAPLVAE